MGRVAGAGGGSMSERVCAVVVTFNRKLMLRPCLHSLLAQERPLDQILVVDNASTDGTPDLLREEFPNLTVLRLEKNTGGAGGFHAGMRWAFDQGFDWVWVMDDDIEMKPEALTVLLRHQEFGDLIQLRKTHPEGPLIWEAVWNASGCSAITCERDVSFDNGKPWTSISYANFEGAFIRRSVMERIGFPDVRYFIGGDDTIYGLIASFHARVIYVDYIGVVKRVAMNQLKTRLHYYLQVRNLFLNYEHFRALGVPVVRSMFLLQTARTALANWSEILHTPKQRTWVNVRAVGWGLWHGRQGRFGPPPWIR